MTKKVIGYVRGRKYMGKWAKDRQLQLAQFKQFAEANGYDLITNFIEDQKFSLKNKTGALVLAKVLKRCRRENVDLLYIDIGRLRRNTVFSDIIKDFRHREEIGKPYPYKLIPVPGALETIEAIERHTRFEKFDYRLRQRRARKKPEERDDPLSIWQRENKVGTKRLKNFKSPAPA